VSAPLNLARRPFRNERLPTLVLAAACLALAAATARHALVARDLAPGRSRDVASEVVAIEKEIDTLRAESADLRQLAAPPDALKEWAAVKRLVDRRMFSWTGLFAALEQALPPGVKLVSISPVDQEGQTELALTAVGRGSEDALALMASLQAHEEFRRPQRLNEGRRASTSRACGTRRARSKGRPIRGRPREPINWGQADERRAGGAAGPSGVPRPVSVNVVASRINRYWREERRRAAEAACRGRAARRATGDERGAVRGTRPTWSASSAASPAARRRTCCRR
jgi:Tfp pilus assembly protein PilN